MKKYALVGAGGRALSMFAQPMARELKDAAELVGVYDVNAVRANQLSLECGNVPVYDDFDQMISESKAEAVIVATIDKFHDEYIIRSLDAGCDVISEKPMTIDGDKCKAIIEAEERTGKKVTVTLNCRYMPYVARIKQLIKEGAVGEILSVDFEWALDTSHGADYFRRWHRRMENSGGLLIHKSSHHFDMVNWWLEEDPEELYAFGSKRFYGPTRENRGERCSTCNYQNTCEFYFDITKNPFTKSYYYEAESEDGYIRDRCVFSEDIDIYDTMSVNVKYSKGAFLTYSLIAHSPYEGWKATISGTNGRIEAEQFHSGHRADERNSQIKIYNRKGEVVTYDIKRSNGTHDGGDERLRRMIFVGDISDPLGQQAGSWAGVMSVLIGAAANISIAEKRPVIVKSLLE
jgi:predicted dehydrogenase